MGRFAWVTLATNDSYCLGALVLAYSLRKVGTQHEFAILVAPTVSDSMRERLGQIFNVVQEVNVLDSKDETNLLILKRPELGITFTKLHCWRLTQFEKCVFLDADTLVVKNCDELFEREELSAAPDVGWPDCFNSGVFVYRPSLDTFNSLVQFASEKGSFDGGDQGLLNLYFSGWAHTDISKHLPFIYNMCSTACYSYLPAFKQFGANAKIIHFIGIAKPWLQQFDTESGIVHPSADCAHLQHLLQTWWDLFCSFVHPNLTPNMSAFRWMYSQQLHSVNSAGTLIQQKIPRSHHKDPEFIIYPPPNTIKTVEKQFYDSREEKTYQKDYYDPWEDYYERQSQTVECHSADNVVVNRHSAETMAENVPVEMDVVVQNGHGIKTSDSVVTHHSDDSVGSIVHKEHSHSVETVVVVPHTDDSVDSIVYNKRSHDVETCNSLVVTHADDSVDSTVHKERSHTDITVQNIALSSDTNNTVVEKTDNAENNISDCNNSVVSKSCAIPLSVNPVTVNTALPCSNDNNEVNEKDQSAGLAGAFAQMTLGAPRSSAQSALEDHFRRQSWEVGNIDYMGRDSFTNIWQKICETLSGPSPAPAPTKAPAQKSRSPARKSASPKASSPPKQTVTAQSEVAKPKSSDDCSSGETKPVDVKQITPIEPEVVKECSKPEEKCPKSKTKSEPKSAPATATVETKKEPKPKEETSVTPKPVEIESKTVPEVPKTVPETKTKSKTKAESKVEATKQAPATKPAPKPEPTVKQAPEPESKPASKPEPATKQAPKQESETKQAPKPEPTPPAAKQAPKLESAPPASKQAPKPEPTPPAAKQTPKAEAEIKPAQQESKKQKPAPKPVETPAPKPVETPAPKPVEQPAEAKVQPEPKSKKSEESVKQAAKGTTETPAAKTTPQVKTTTTTTSKAPESPPPATAGADCPLPPPRKEKKAGGTTTKKTSAKAKK